MLLRIENVANRQNDIAIIRNWISVSPADEALSNYLKHITENDVNKYAVPMMLIALLDEEPVGVISLMNENGCMDSSFTPWIAHFFVVEEQRSRGIGTYMHNYLLEEALTMGYEKVYIAVDQADYLEERGWNYLESKKTKNGSTMLIYVKEIEV
ncbi:GNAT family N-acetyltransferase [Paenibacillus sinopodophylli]|uniref:GNAT family N-acetyltransferase n=1 Tax=Paenibacillus sinopodophylli TaxID=1837342 RepID=UPI00110CA6D9|nr:GNAT family N-acetyltransferase [Paenibacillus sinopodophylli]